MAELADAGDLKSPTLGYSGSTPDRGTMNVEQLIRKLDEFDPEMEVVVYVLGYEEKLDDVDMTDGGICCLVPGETRGR